MLFFGHVSLCQWLSVSRVMISLVTGRVDSFFWRSMPHVTFWLVMSFQMPNSTTYKQQNSSPTLYISEIFFLDICCLGPRLEVFPHLQSPFVQIQVFSSSSSLGFKFSSKCLKLLFPRLAIVLIRPQTSTMIQLVTVLQCSFSKPVCPQPTWLNKTLLWLNKTLLLLTDLLAFALSRTPQEI